MNELQLRDAKATLSAVVDNARQGAPTIITRHGKPTAVVISFEEWERLSHVPSYGRPARPERRQGALRMGPR